MQQRDYTNETFQMGQILKPELVAVRLDRKLDSMEVEFLLRFISPEKKEVIGNYYREEDQLRSLVADLLIRMVVMQYVDIENNAIRFIHSENGKPMLSGMEGFHFNTSHAGDWVVCVFDNTEIGTDVEFVKTANLSISRSFFTEEEHYDICNAPDPNDRFFDYWTLKESFIKHNGKGLSQALNEFVILFSENPIRVALKGKRVENVYLKQYSLDDAHKLAVCASSSSLPESISYKSMDEIIAFFSTISC
jgi:4'-phosphopantetheinyl transferase